LNKDERTAALTDKLERIEDRTDRIWAKNQFEDFPVYKAPTDLDSDDRGDINSHY
jgi:hypothetical protein